MRQLRVGITMFVLIIVFSITTVLTPVWLLILLLVGRWEQAGYVLQSMDRLAAASVGFTGKNTVSKECGLCETCWLCGPLCKILAWALGEPHCQEEAR